MAGPGIFKTITKPIRLLATVAMLSRKREEAEYISCNENSFLQFLALSQNAHLYT